MKNLCIRDYTNFLKKAKLYIKVIFDFNTRPVQNVIHSIEKQEKSSCMFLDFAKACETADHKILIKKLNYYGIRGIAHRMFESYLANRKQAVKIVLNHSSFQTVVYGVPQGSVLGPLLFLSYMSDIHISSSKAKFHLFVDDTCIFHSNKNLHRLENEVNGALKISQIC